MPTILTAPLPRDTMDLASRYFRLNISMATAGACGRFLAPRFQSGRARAIMRSSLQGNARSLDEAVE